MRKRRLLLFIVLSVTVVIAVLCIQGYWLYQAYRLTNDDFREKVQTSLRVVAIRIRNLNAITTNEVVHINEQHANYFIAHIDNYIDPKLLETFLMNEFQRNDVLANFEFGIYDCAENNIRYGGYVCVDEHCDTTNTVHYNFPKLNETNYYFAVYFPNRSNFLFNQMRHWIASTLALIVLMLLFVYAVYLLLRQKKLSAMQQDFVNNITHEFKTPVASIAIATEMLEQENPLRQPNKYKLYVSVLRRETERLKMHIDSILRSTMQRHQHVFQMQQVSLHNQIHELLPSWEMLLLSCNGKINLEFNAKNDLIHFDTFHLQNILFNLFDNAVKYASTTPEIRLRTQNVGKYLVITFSDNGIGIPNEKINKVFDKFYRVQSGNIHDVKGFGLGLYYVKEVLKQTKATIAVSSKLHVGTVFTIRFLNVSVHD